ncbi:MAG: UDP-N-acetylmuramate dehydrogenase [Zoogloeaceae bacterium]|jgi:UDP-N-acetylmuramate dehydrogenase|nr:UDP-N-acetylmuramate dehydrogenase [Zoogloeaceae bacterium]
MLPDFVSPQADLAPYNTLALPARAGFLARIHSVEQLATLMRHPEFAGRPRFVLGGGSNLILAGDFPGFVLNMRIPGKRWLGEDADCVYLAAAAGESWSDFVDWTLASGWPGLENLVGIPGTAGAAPIQNIGAYGAEISEFLHRIVALDMARDGKTRAFTARDCAFDYRDSIFKREGWHLSGRYVITEVVFRLPKAWRARAAYGEIGAELARRGIQNPAPAELAQIVTALRAQKLPDPRALPNAGSFFQNPKVPARFAAALQSAHPSLPCYPQPDGSVKLAAAWLIEQTGWKGRNLGAVGMHEQQALVLVNRGGASYHDVLNLSRAVREAVFARFGVSLIPEPVTLAAPSRAVVAPEK